MDAVTMFAECDSDQTAGSVSYSESELRAATLLLARLIGVDRGAVERAIAKLVSDAGPKNRAEVVARAERIRKHRARRGELFPQPIFGEPPWEMLMALFVDYPENGATTSQLAASTGLPSTTAARWLGYLEDHGLVQRRSHPADRRCRLVELTDTARAALDKCFADSDLF